MSYFRLQVAWASRSCIRDRGNTPLYANEACGLRAWLAVVFSLLRMSDKGHMHSEGNRGAVASALAASTRLLGGDWQEITRDTFLWCSGETVGRWCHRTTPHQLASITGIVLGFPRE